MSDISAGRSFGKTVGIAFGLLAGWLAWRGASGFAWGCAVLAVALLSLAWLAPRLLRRPRQGWQRVAHVLGWINSRIILSVMFFGVLTPAGFIARGLGWDPLQARGARRGSSGWMPYQARVRDGKHYERMF